MLAGKAVPAVGLARRSLRLVSAGVVAALVWVGTTSCELASPEPLGPDSGAKPGEAVIGVPFELPAGGQVTLAEEGLRLEFLDVPEDSRCPVDVTCVWEGDAIVQLRLSHPAEDPTGVELHTSPSFTREASYASYRIRLLELRPQPRSDARIEAEDYVATLEVRRESE